MQNNKFTIYKEAEVSKKEYLEYLKNKIKICQRVIEENFKKEEKYSDKMKKERDIFQKKSNEYLKKYEELNKE